ncbi:hypothetical protein FBBAL38_05610 [Flavobacteria bacterium BAL38]|uniref:hypothetical protein n=1 Tax=unclassified Flavobacterium TaxID=196869 RepID=UPI0000F3992E|nr:MULTISPECIES: hypothetical protein [unclassified Flavobacterium]EAZ96875.1 hypothetical protein FBBAL38_05610 [Flavobacteria bacterium BAL38]MQP51482.1 hypothetical protein [Flavobacterium sp. LMO9]MQP61290.1 hypothetical protein [Flavobacterium sp. LMO6]
MNKDDIFILLSLGYGIGGILFSCIYTYFVIKYTKSLLSKWGLIFLLVIIGGSILYQYLPIFNNNGRVAFVDETNFLAIAFLFTPFLFLIVRDITYLNTNLIKLKIKDAQEIAKQTKLEVVGIDENLKHNRLDLFKIFYRGKLNGIYNFNLLSSCDYPVMKLNSNADPRFHYYGYYKRFTFQINEKYPHRFFISTSHNLEIENSMENLIPFISNNTKFNDLFGIYIESNSSSHLFFNDIKVQQILIDNFTNIKGYIDFNFEIGKGKFKSSEINENSISTFNRNWRNIVNQMHIKDISLKIKLLEELISEWDYINSTYQHQSETT